MQTCLVMNKHGCLQQGQFLGCGHLVVDHCGEWGAVLPMLWSRYHLRQSMKVRKRWDVVLYGCGLEKIQTWMTKTGEWLFVLVFYVFILSN